MTHSKTLAFIGTLLICLLVGLAIPCLTAADAKPATKLSDIDARAIREIELAYVRSQNAMAQAQLQFRAAQEQAEKANAAYEALKTRLKSQYNCEKCELLGDLTWQRPPEADALKKAGDKKEVAQKK